MSNHKLNKGFTLGTLVNTILYFIIGLLILIVIWFAWFLYTDFYTTISRAETVLILKSELAVDVLNVPLYEKIKNEFQKNTPSSASPAASTHSTPENLFSLPNPFISK